jgi:predicted RNA-binding protein associated with RNAse of E/G family
MLGPDMTKRWSSGGVVVLRHMGRIRAGTPAIVVEDGRERVMAYVPHGVRWFGAPAPAAGRIERVRAIARGETAVTGHLIPWRNHMLRVLLPDRPFSVWLLWSPEWEFKSYYVNLEAPFARSAVGFDSSDHTLDVCVRADRTWYYKDQDELDTRIEVGLVDAEAAAQVRRDAEQAVALIEGWQPPFSSGLEEWRPDPSWPLPELPPQWDAHASEIEPWLRYRPPAPAAPPA